LFSGATTGEVILSGRTDISSGLPQSPSSFSSVEVFDSDSDGKDEIYMGGCGFLDMGTRTEGIHAYEFSPGANMWTPFGSGLPGKGSGEYYGALGLGDINGDGHMDIIGPKPSRWYDIPVNGVDIYSGSGSGKFTLLHTIPLESGDAGSSNEAEAADLDDDGFVDIVVSTYSGVNVFFGDGSGTNWVESSPPHAKRTEISGIGIGDLNNDGLLDIVGTPYQYSQDVEMYTLGTRRSWRDIPFKEVSGGFGTKVLDMNGDGNSDVIYGAVSQGIKVWLGQGTTSLTGFPCTEASTGLPAEGQFDQIELSDINGDERPDMIAGSNSGPYARLFLNDLPEGWTEIFTGPLALEVGGDSYGANFGDWDGNGQLDVAACSWEDGADAWLVTTTALNENQPPVADAGTDIISYVDEEVVLDGSGSYDTDGTVQGYEWQCSSHPAIPVSGLETSRPRFTPATEDIYRFKLRVRDNEGVWSAYDMVDVTVLGKDVNLPPVADAGADRTVEVGQKITLDGSGSQDADGYVSDYEWTCTTHTVTMQNEDGPSPSFVPDGEGDFIFQLVVTDDQGARSAPDRVTVHATVPLGPVDEDPKNKDDDQSPIILIMVLGTALLLIIAASIGVIIWARSGKKGPPAEEVLELPSVCPQCRTELVHNKDFNRYQCPTCGRYY
jgi:hypothetical protein